MKHFISSTLTVLCVLGAGMQALARVQSTELSLAAGEPQGTAADQGVDILDSQASPDDDNAAEVTMSQTRAMEINDATGLFWRPRRRPIRRIRRPVYIRPRPRPRPRPYRPRPAPRRPNKNINVSGANGGTNIGGNGANGGNIRVSRDVQVNEDKASIAKDQEDEYRRRRHRPTRPIRAKVNVKGANGGFNYGGNGANGGKINVNAGGRGRRPGGGKGAKTTVSGANGGENYYGNGANGGNIRVKA